MPALLRVRNAINKNLHAFCEEGLLFIEICDVKSTSLPRNTVTHFKEKPLSIPVSIDIPLHEQVVFVTIR
jgi:hypothetical protein